MASSVVQNAGPAVSGPMSGARVVECGQGVSAAFAAKLLSQLGAEVIKVEPPQGDLARTRGPFPADTPDPEAGGLFAYLNANKMGVTLDLSADDGRARLLNLLADADILIHNVPPADRDAMGLNSERLVRVFPQLILSTISPFGDRGPRANFRAYDLNGQHAGGLASGNAAASDPSLAPVKLFGHQADFQGGVHCALVTLAAFLYRLGSGRGQAIDLSQQECLAPMIELNWPFYSYARKEITRLGGRFNPQPADVFECADGKVLMTVYGDHIWRRFVEFMGSPQWALNQEYNDAFARVRDGDFIKDKVLEWTAGWKVADLCRGLQQLPVPIEPVKTVAEVYADAHLQQRRAFVSIPLGDGHELEVPGPPLRLGAAVQANRAAPGRTQLRRLRRAANDAVDAPRKAASNRLIRGAPSRRRPAGGNQGAGFQLGVGRSLRRPATGPSGRRRNPRGKRAPALHVSQHSADGRRHPRPQPCRRLQSMEPGQAQHRAGPRPAAGGGNRAPTGAPLRRGGGELCRRLDRPHGSWLRNAAAIAARPDHAVDVRLRPDRPLQHASELRRADRSDVGFHPGQRLSRQAYKK